MIWPLNRWFCTHDFEHSLDVQILDRTDPPKEGVTVEGDWYNETYWEIWKCPNCGVCENRNREQWVVRKDGDDIERVSKWKGYA